jgi:hypothetical protein
MKQLVQRFELALWDRIIPILSDSTMIRQAVRTGYYIFHDRANLVMSSIVIALSGAIGLVTGLILRMVKAYIW